MHCVQYIWNIDIMQARAWRLERKMEEDQVRRALRYLAKVETVEYRAKVPVTLSRSVASRHNSAAMRTRTPCKQVRLPEVANEVNNPLGLGLLGGLP